MMSDRETVFNGIIGPLRDMVAALALLPNDPDARGLKIILDRAASEAETLRDKGANPRRVLEVIK